MNLGKLHLRHILGLSTLHGFFLLLQVAKWKHRLNLQVWFECGLGAADKFVLENRLDVAVVFDLDEIWGHAAVEGRLAGPLAYFKI